MRIHLFELIVTVVLIISSGIIASAQDIASGKEIFTQTCGACHTVGRGRLVGPDLVNIHQRRTEDWVVKFVKSSQSVIKSGDKYADSLFRAFNQVVMPDQPTLSDDKIKNIVSYIKTSSSAPVTASTGNNTEQSNLNTNNNKGELFTTANIFLFGIILFMLIVIWSLSRINKNLADQIRDYYSSDRSFYQ